MLRADLSPRGMINSESRTLCSNASRGRPVRFGVYVPNRKVYMPEITPRSQQRPVLVDGLGLIKVGYVVWPLSQLGQNMLTGPLLYPGTCVCVFLIFVLWFCRNRK